MNLEELKARLTREEGKRNKMYPDSNRIPTIGVGHNLKDKPISDRAVDVILEDDINEVLSALDESLPWWRNLDEVRQLVIADMAFNMGVGPTTKKPNGKLLTFNTTLKLIQQGDYADAADHMRQSTWATQVGSRARDLADMMENG